MSVRSSPRVPKYRHHKPSGLASVRVDGRDIYLGKHGTPESLESYKRVIAEWLSNNKVVSPSPATAANLHGRSVDELILRYLDFAKTYYVKNCEPTGEYKNVCESLRPLTQLYGKVRVEDFGPSALKAVRQAMIDANLCRGTINSRINRIRRVFKWGVENELVPPHILHGLQAVAPLKLGRCNVREAIPVKPVPDHMIQPVLEHVSPQVAAMIQLQLLTGMRPGEVMQMRAEDLDMSGQTWTYRPATHKTQHHGRQRVIYLGPKAQSVIRPFLKPDGSAWLFSPHEAMVLIHRQRRADRKTPLSPSQRARRRKRYPRRAPGDRYDRRGYAWAIRRACDEAFPPPDHLNEKQQRQWRREHRWSPNQLRHNAATHLRKQFGLEAARVVLGHSSADVTEIYAELDLSKAADIMARVG
ncbi:MAG: tyrosine-type recombinase/integrase [Nitrospira sp. CR1.3]|nr:tyrosine-type recombinase/integrase [Nitrospira sp. CR1.3]